MIQKTLTNYQWQQQTSLGVKITDPAKGQQVATGKN